MCVLYIISGLSRLFGNTFLTFLSYKVIIRCIYNDSVLDNNNYNNNNNKLTAQTDDLYPIVYYFNF